MADFSTWLWSTLTGTDIATVQATSDAADAQLQTLNNAQYAPGGTIYNKIAATQGTQAADAAWKNVQNDDASSAANTANITGQVSDAFQTQLSSETSGIGSTFSSFLSGLFKNAFNIIPWQVWVIGGIALFIWLGGLSLFKGSLSKEKN
jgi:hypothetical protein